jgi:hypothetical protein
MYKSEATPLNHGFCDHAPMAIVMVSLEAEETGLVVDGGFDRPG